jgi:excisionase family DNA binding protein
MAEEWLTTAEAAELSGYHPERIRELVRDGRINGRKFGIVWQIDRRSLLAFLKETKDSGDKRRGPKTQ